MVITILEAEVDEKNWQALEKAYADKTASITPDIEQTFLVQSKQQPELWRIITHWRSQDDLDRMRQTEGIPVGVQIFQEAKANPTLSLWDIKDHKTQSDCDP